MASEQDKDKAADKAAEKAPPTKATATAAPRRGDAAQNPAEGVAEQLRAGHEQRVTVPGAPNVDARLDNRTGANRPLVETWPAKPQQVDGPDVMHQVEHTRAALAERERVAGERKGMFSPGPHGLSDESLREAGAAGEGAAGSSPLYGTESVPESDLSGNPTAG